MGALGAPELLIVFVLVMVLFGSSKLPQFARSLGQAQKEFRGALKEGFEDKSNRA